MTKHPYNEKHPPFGNWEWNPILTKIGEENTNVNSKLIDYGYWIANVGPVWFDINMPHTATLNYKHDPGTYLPKFLEKIVEWDKETDGIENSWTWSYLEIPNVENPEMPIKKIKVYAQSEEDLLKIIMFIG